ncbi:MAG TPA: GerMN domain-containing protein [Lachnospiraceae bacterium]|nr:GerMN domain-containing protein [Lachnospiraceae bacterium]
MKKILVAVAILCAVITFSACNGKDKTKNNPIENIDTDEAEDEGTEEDTKEDTDVNTETQDEVAEDVEKATIDDYYPFTKDTVYIFEGEGNEYAGFQTSIDFIDEGKSRMQTRTNNGGTEDVRIIEKKDGEVRVILSRPECYYRDNLIDKEGDQGKEEILLKEPLEVGTEWALPDGGKRYISGVDVDIETPMGTYQAIQVNTQESGESEYIIKEYYVKGIGLVKRVYESEGMVVTSAIKEIKEDTAFSQMMDLYFVNADEKIYSEPVTLTFRTNDITRVTIQKAVTKAVEGKKDTLPLMSINTKINSMYLGDDGIAYIDLSKEFVSDMNAGVGYEAAILQAITNTIGRYYGVQEVYLTIDQKPYESGHMLFEKGQTMKVTE